MNSLSVNIWLLTYITEFTRPVQIYDSIYTTKKQRINKNYSICITIILIYDKNTDYGLKGPKSEQFLALIISEPYLRKCLSHLITGIHGSVNTMTKVRYVCKNVQVYEQSWRDRAPYLRKLQKIWQMIIKEEKVTGPNQQSKMTHHCAKANQSLTQRYHCDCWRPEGFPFERQQT